jgi:hypothetical protein
MRRHGSSQTSKDALSGLCFLSVRNDHRLSELFMLQLGFCGLALILQPSFATADFAAPTNGTA